MNIRLYEVSKDSYTDDHYGRLSAAVRQAYNPDQSICPVYVWCDDDRDGRWQGCCLIRHATAILSGSLPEGDNAAITLSCFLEAHCVAAVEGPLHIMERLKLKHFVRVERTAFNLTSAAEMMSEDDAREIIFSGSEGFRLDDVYAILETGFPLKDGYAVWLTDTSLMLRRGISRVAIWKQTQTTVTQVYSVKGWSFYSQVATHPDGRGRGGARRLLKHMAYLDKMCGRQSFLFARAERKSFYISSGFREMDDVDNDRQWILERK